MHSTPSLLRGERRGVLIAALAFLLIGWGLQIWRLQMFTATLDQGILLQVLWNGLSGHPFESTLSSQLSTNVVHGGDLPAIGYHRLGQHFTPTLALWIPLVGLLGKWALPLLQVSLTRVGTNAAAASRPRHSNGYRYRCRCYYSSACNSACARGYDCCFKNLFNLQNGVS